jgi:hypothetical protein
MNKRITALLTTVASLPVVAMTLIGAAPANAQPGANCGSYPPGQAYGIRATTNHVAQTVTQVKKGGTVLFTARVFRGGENCSGRSVVFFVHGPGEFVNGVPGYHVSARATTDANGIAVYSKTVLNSFRWYAAYQSDNGTGIVSTRGGDRLVQAV